MRIVTPRQEGHFEREGWKQRLKDDPKGFSFESKGRNCSFCKQTVWGDIWYDKNGLKCLWCHEACDTKLFPQYVFTDKKNEAKDGTHYDLPEKVVDPPKYMNVESKIKYDSPSKSNYSTLTTNRRSPEKKTRWLNYFSNVNKYSIWYDQLSIKMKNLTGKIFTLEAVIIFCALVFWIDSKFAPPLWLAAELLGIALRRSSENWGWVFFRY